MEVSYLDQHADRPGRMSDETNEKGGSGCLIILAAIGLLMVVAAIVIPNVLQAHKHNGSSSAIGALKTLQTSESIFREGDKENDGNLDYGMLSELSSTGMIDRVLGTGTKQGYLYVAEYSPTTSEFLWFAVAVPDPQRSDATEQRSFFTNEAGVIFYTTGGAPIPVNAEVCEVRSNLTTVTPIGK